MHIVYFCDFDLSDTTGGKYRATKQKIQALERKSNRFKAFYLTKPGHFYKVLFGVLLDIQCAYYLLRHRPDALIARGGSNYLSLFVCKLLGIKTAREVHGVFSNELGLLPHKGFKLKLIILITRFYSKLNTWADIRIFNHPFVYEHYKKQGRTKQFDIVCYNGYSAEAVVPKNKEEARKKHGLDLTRKYLAFTGSVSAWHGAEYLTALQQEFNKNGDEITIVVGGGSMAEYDPQGLCINISPLDEVGCSEIITASDACLLPVKNNRISPGSPLKLYDYIAHKKYIFAQDIAGYSDEVEKYDVGCAVDFADAAATRLAVVKFFNENQQTDDMYEDKPVTWDDRVVCWIDAIKKSMI